MPAEQGLVCVHFFARSIDPLATLPSLAYSLLRISDRKAEVKLTVNFVFTIVLFCDTHEFMFYKLLSASYVME